MKVQTPIVYPPYEKGFLKVSGGHKLYYELYGNPKGKPVVYVHGGPGSGFSEKDKRFFDPKIWNVLLFDQRGAGRSTPFASIANNTTWDLVDDMVLLMDKVGFTSATLFGGSWGSTLSLIFTITHPDRVVELILRGIFLARKTDLDYLYVDARKLRPIAWERFMSLVPPKERKNVIHYYLEKMQSKDQKVRTQHAFEWALFELSLLRLKTPLEKVINEMQTDESYISLAILEAHYFVNNCYFEENYILKNVPKIGRIPTTIVHGEYDLVCSPLSAYELHKKMPQSKIYFIHGGHAASDKAMERKLTKVLQQAATR